MGCLLSSCYQPISQSIVNNLFWGLESDIEFCSSSLERVRSQNEKLLTSVEEIKGFIYGPRHKSEVPMIGGQTDQQFQFELTRDMMAMAELNGRPWSSIGIDNWIQAGKWWLMKVRFVLRTTISRV